MVLLFTDWFLGEAPLFADETANVDFYSLVGLSAKIIKFINYYFFLWKLEKLSNREKQGYFVRFYRSIYCSFFRAYVTYCRPLTDFIIKVCFASKAWDSRRTENERAFIIWCDSIPKPSNGQVSFPLINLSNFLGVCFANAVRFEENYFWLSKESTWAQYRC